MYHVTFRDPLLRGHTNSSYPWSGSQINKIGRGGGQGVAVSPWRWQPSPGPSLSTAAHWQYSDDKQGRTRSSAECSCFNLRCHNTYFLLLTCVRRSTIETHCFVLYIVTLHVDVSSSFMVILLYRQQYGVLGLYVKYPIVLTIFFFQIWICMTLLIGLRSNDTCWQTGMTMLMALLAEHSKTQRDILH